MLHRRTGPPAGENGAEHDRPVTSKIFFSAVIINPERASTGRSSGGTSGIAHESAGRRHITLYRRVPDMGHSARGGIRKAR
jgi:hypothetical protein